MVNRETCDYHGEHSITIGDKNTFTDWHLVPIGRPTFAPPSVDILYNGNPTADGIIDLTESLNGFPVLGSREGQFEFAVLNDYLHWHDAYTRILNYLHGRRLRAILSDDPMYYYMARWTVDEWQSEEARDKIVIKYLADPYKISMLTSIETGWLWDPFCFEDGIILPEACKDIAVGGNAVALELTGYQCGRMPVKPKLNYRSNTSGATLNVSFSNPELYLQTNVTVQNNQSKEFDDIIMSGYDPANPNHFEFSGTDGVVSVIFRRGDL